MAGIKQSDLTLAGQGTTTLELGHFHSIRANIDTLYAKEIVGSASSNDEYQSTIVELPMTIQTELWATPNTVDITFTKVGNIVTAYLPKITATSIDRTGVISIRLFPSGTTLEAAGVSPPPDLSSTSQWQPSSSNKVFMYDGVKYPIDIYIINGDSPESPAMFFVIAVYLDSAIAGKDITLDPMYFTYYTK